MTGRDWRDLRDSPVWRIPASTIADDRAERIAAAASERAALHELAEREMPCEIRDWCARWRIPALGEYMWVLAFVSGWRLAMKARRPGD